MRFHLPEFHECAKANAKLALDHRDAGKDLNPVARASERRSYRVRANHQRVTKGERAPKMADVLNIQASSTKRISPTRRKTAPAGHCARQSNQSSGDTR